MKLSHESQNELSYLKARINILEKMERGTEEQREYEQSVALVKEVAEELATCTEIETLTKGCVKYSLILRPTKDNEYSEWCKCRVRKEQKCFILGKEEFWCADSERVYPIVKLMSVMK